MIRSFRYPLHPTPAQERTLASWLLSCQQLYNGALQHRRDAWRLQRVTVGRNEQYRELTQLRAADREWKSVPAMIARSALARVDRAYQAFFRRLRTGAVPGYPRFQSPSRYSSFDLGSDIPRLNGGRVRVPKLGFVRFHKYREIRGDVRRITICRTARGWIVVFECNLGDAPPKAPVRSAVGIDLGLEAFATLSTGERVANPRFFVASQAILARRQRVLSRTRRGSAGRRAARRLVARTHEHIRNQRLDFARKLACTLFARFDLIAHEDLAIARMVHGNLAKSIYDAAWGTFLRALASKAEEAGKWSVPVDPRGTSQRCARCSAVVKKSLDAREHRCPSCGFVTHRDHNASLNIEALGLSAGLLTEAADILHGLSLQGPVQTVVKG